VTLREFGQSIATYWENYIIQVRIQNVLDWSAHSTEVGHLFHAKVGTRSTASWAAIPREGGRLI